MGSSRAGKVYRVRQLPRHLEGSSRTAIFLASINADLGAADNIRVASLAQENTDSKTATVTFKTLPSRFDNDEQQWTIQAEAFSGQNIIVDTHFRGFTVLSEPRHSPHTADCVAISGLASHSFGSWKYRGIGSDFMWLRDRLPKDVPQLRSLIYGYDTTLFKSHSFQDLDDIARLFIASLKEIRRSLPPPKPLFFLAHSLGGIVLKRALVLLDHHGKDEEKKILESVKGVVFFGVPHRGMKISHLLAMVEKQPNEDLINMTLSPESILLPELDKEFSKIPMGGKQNIRFVYETVQSQLTERNPAGTWVRSETSYDTLVNKDSAVPPGTPPLHTIAVNEDHSNMVKFGEGDSVYHFVKSFLFDVSKDTDGHRSSHSTPTYSPASQIVPLGTQDPNKGCIVDSSLSTPTQKSMWPFSTVPFPRDSNFVGREDILAQLKDEFKSLNWASLFGLGGIGKSQIAIEYSYRQKEWPPRMSTFWVHASSKARFEQSYVELATKVDLPGSGDGKVDILPLVSKWLADEDNGAWLLIVDNADDANLLLGPPRGDNGSGAVPAQRGLIDFLPRVQHGAVLITTRDRTCALRLTGYRGTPIEVLSMSLNESVELLRILLPEADQAEASELVEELEKMPLAISQASAYIKEVPRVSIPKYLAIFRRSNEDKVALLNKNKEDLRRDGEVPNAVITSWELSFNQLRSGSANLLSLMSYFNRQAIPQFLIQGNDDEASFEEDINPLISFSLIRAEIREDTFEMHRLVQVATQHWLCSEGYDQLWKERAVERVAHQFPMTDQRQYWPLCEALMSHADEVIPYISGSKESELERADILGFTAWYLIERHGHAELAGQRSTDALQIRQRYFSDDSAQVLDSLTTLALAQHHLQKYEEAKGLREIVLKQRLKIWGPEHRGSLALMHNLALSYQSLGNYEKAKDLLESVVEVREKTLAQEDPDLLRSRIVLASIYINLGKFEEAEKVYVENLEVYTRCYELQHPDGHSAMHNLSEAYLAQNKVEAAENLITKFIPLSTKLFGPTHWRTLNARRSLAEIYRRQGKLDEAKGICLSCLEIAQKFYPPRHETTLAIKVLLGIIYGEQKEFDDALRFLRDTAETCMDLWGADHPTTLIYMQNLAICHHDMGDKNHAIHLMTEVLEKQKRVLPTNHPDTTDSANWLAYWKGEVEESVDWESEADETEEWETEEEESDEIEKKEEDIMSEQLGNFHISSPVSPGADAK